MNQALSLISLSIKDCVIPNIMQETTPGGCWSKLKVLFENRSTTCKIFLENKLSNLKMMEEMSKHTYLE